MLGDAVYGNADWNKRYRRSDDVQRPLLHAYELQFQHPLFDPPDRTITVTAPVPPDMVGLIRKIANAPFAYRSHTERGTLLIDEPTGLLTCGTDLFRPPTRGSSPPASAAQARHAPLESMRVDGDPFEWQSEVENE